MAYNLDFSAWKDMRKAMSDSILNQANIEANLIAQKYNTLNKTISGLAKNALWAYDQRKAQEDEAAAQAAIDRVNANNAVLQQQGITGLAIDPMQALSASNQIEAEEEKNRERRRIVNGLLRY